MTYNYIAIDAKGLALYDLRNANTVHKLVAQGADFEYIPLEIDPYMQGLGVDAYATATGFELGSYYSDNQWIADNNSWAVFNPTVADFANSFDSYTESLDGKRFLLKRCNPNYAYQGTGSHDGGTPIAAQQLTPDEVSILTDSPFWDATADTNVETNRFIRSDRFFAATQVQWSKTSILQAEATLEEKNAAFNLCANVLNQLQFGFISTAYYFLNALVPAGVFTSQMKSELMARFAAYLNKFPR